MELSLNQVRERLEKPTYAKAIREAVEHEDRIKLHAKTVDKAELASSYYPKFLQWVANGVKLQSDKFEVFKAMCAFPLSTNSLCNSIYDEYERIFSATDAVTEVTFADNTMKQEFESYLTRIALREYFKTDGFKAYQTQPASIYVVDMPAVQTSTRPEPYFYRVGISAVVDIATSRQATYKTDKIEYVIFKTEDDTYIAVDDYRYRVLKKIKTAQPGEVQYMLVSEAAHNLGYCPASFMIHDPLYDAEDRSPIARRAPISAVAGDLDWLLFYKVGERMYETYGVFPIMTVPETNCSFVDAATGNPCTSGYVSVVREDGSPSYYACPACKENSLVGAGTVFTKPVPKTKDQPELTKPVEITPPDIPSLDYVTKKIDYLEWEIFESCIGSNDDQVTAEAINEKQVQSNVEGKRNVLMRVKRDFELTEEFLIDTMGRLMYGPYYSGCNVNYGEDFLLYTEQDIVKQYDVTKKSGLPIFLLAEKKQLLISSTTRNNTYQAQRMKILDLLEPWTELSLSECMTFQLNVMYPDKFLLKSDFAKFVSKFELENGDIVEWGKAISFDTKIKNISDKLIEYARTETSKAVKPEPDTKPEGTSKRA
jgi:hypothetical protein